MNKLEKLQYMASLFICCDVICETPCGKLKLLSINIADGIENALLGFGVNEEGDQIEFYLSEIGSVEVPLFKKFVSKLTQINK